jgi:hypothetical protein
MMSRYSVTSYGMMSRYSAVSYGMTHTDTPCLRVDWQMTQAKLSIIKKQSQTHSYGKDLYMGEGRAI